MSDKGNRKLESTLNFKFTSRRFTTGAPFTLAGTPVLSAYEANSTTEITAGITLTVDFDARTGLNHVRVILAAASGYEAGKDYDIVITTGTVDGVSVVGETVGYFSIENRFEEVDVTKWLGTAVATPSVAGVPEVDVTLVAGSAEDIATATALAALVTTIGTAGDGLTAVPLSDETITLPGQVTPTVTPTLAEAVGLIYKALRNRSTNTATQRTLFADNGTTIDQKSAVSDDTVTYDKGKMLGGP